MDKQLIARWESKSRKYWVELYTDRYGATYKAPWAGGNLGNITAIEAEAILQKRVDNGEFQPDANKTPMKRVR